MNVTFCFYANASN